MDSIIHKGMSYLEDEIKKLDTSFEDSDSEIDIISLNNNLEQVSQDLNTLESSSEQEISSAELKLLLSKIDSLRSKLMSTELNFLDNNTSLKKDLIDEIGMVIIGMNNINHYLVDSVNQNERTLYNIEERLGKIETKNKLLISSIVIMIIIIVFQMLIFFNK